jgi:hypothetical protein
MRAKVTDEGLVIPLDLLEGHKEVEIRKEGDQILILLSPEVDPILGLGSEPVECGAPDASENHDFYLYGTRT